MTCRMTKAAVQASNDLAVDNKYLYVSAEVNQAFSGKIYTIHGRSGGELVIETVR